METTEFYEQLLEIRAPWRVEKTELDLAKSQATITVTHEKGKQLHCPECGKVCSVFDHRQRMWRHLDTCQVITIIKADVPRVQCDEHGVHQVRVPWAEIKGRYTSAFESRVITQLRSMPISAVAEHERLSWDQADGIMKRAVKRGLARREKQTLQHIAIDETSFQKRHEYVVVITNRETGHVIDVLDDRKKGTLSKWLSENQAQLAQVKTITMDMWPAFISAVEGVIHEANSKICFDKFHVAAYFLKMLNKVRAEEHRALQKEGTSPLTRTKYDWLRSSTTDKNIDTKKFQELIAMNLKTSRAWVLKEIARGLWDFVYRAVAEKSWKALLSRMAHSRLKPMIELGRIVRRHLWGILNAIQHKATNAIAESNNAVIQKIKNRANGFRNRRRFKDAILFHKGGLSMLPDGCA